MSNRIFIDTVHVRYLHPEPGQRQERYGFLIVEDREQHNHLEFSCEDEIPPTLEALLAYCLTHEYTELWDFFADHCDFGQSVEFNDTYYNHEDLQLLMEAVKREHEKGKESGHGQPPVC
jgi:hypothetical protein